MITKSGIIKTKGGHYIVWVKYSSGRTWRSVKISTLQGARWTREHAIKDTTDPAVYEKLASL